MEIVINTIIDIVNDFVNNPNNEYIVYLINKRIYKFEYQEDILIYTIKQLKYIYKKYGYNDDIIITHEINDNNIVNTDINIDEFYKKYGYIIKGDLNFIWSVTDRDRSYVIEYINKYRRYIKYVNENRYDVYKYLEIYECEDEGNENNIDYYMCKNKFNEYKILRGSLHEKYHDWHMGEVIIFLRFEIEKIMKKQKK